MAIKASEDREFVERQIYQSRSTQSLRRDIVSYLKVMGKRVSMSQIEGEYLGQDETPSGNHEA